MAGSILTRRVVVLAAGGPDAALARPRGPRCSSRRRSRIPDPGLVGRRVDRHDLRSASASMSARSTQTAPSPATIALRIDAPTAIGSPTARAVSGSARMTALSIVSDTHSAPSPDGDLAAAARPRGRPARRAPAGPRGRCAPPRPGSWPTDRDRCSRASTPGRRASVRRPPCRPRSGARTRPHRPSSAPTACRRPPRRARPARPRPGSGRRSAAWPRARSPRRARAGRRTPPRPARRRPRPRRAARVGGHPVPHGPGRRSPRRDRRASAPSPGGGDAGVWAPRGDGLRERRRLRTASALSPRTAARLRPARAAPRLRRVRALPGRVLSARCRRLLSARRRVVSCRRAALCALPARRHARRRGRPLATLRRTRRRLGHPAGPRRGVAGRVSSAARSVVVRPLPSGSVVISEASSPISASGWASSGSSVGGPVAARTASASSPALGKALLGRLGHRAGDDLVERRRRRVLDLGQRGAAGRGRGPRSRPRRSRARTAGAPSARRAARRRGRRCPRPRVAGSPASVSGAA